MPNNILHYLAYGSNLHPVRLTERVPSAQLIGKVELPGYRLAFHKKGSVCGSGKCNLVPTKHQSASAWGALYQLEAVEKPLLDGFEGLGNGYETQTFNVSHDAKEYACFTYLAQASHIDESLRPFHWYKDVVSVGARYLGFPEWYLAVIDGHGSIQDWDLGRLGEHQELLVRMEDT